MNETALPLFAPPPAPEAFDMFMGWMQIGGPIVWLLLAMATLALAMIMLKSWQFARLGVGQSRYELKALAHWRNARAEQAIDALAARQTPLARVLRVTIQGLRGGELPDALLREEAQRLALADLESLRHYLRPIEAIGTAAPLLGLLGTVIGMIEAFQQIQAAGSQVDPALLSGGIWQALLTTAVGLSLAIPLSFAHSWLERRIERYGHRIEDALTQVFTGGQPDQSDALQKTRRPVVARDTSTTMNGVGTSVPGIGAQHAT